jgi:4-hydroxy-3-methylbut-2-enyl diphosphate reductase
MKILRAEHLGMCFGVRDAIALALEHSAREPLTILGDLVHNETVLDRLRRQGIQTVRLGEPVPTSTVMVTAHGASDRAKAALQQRGLTVLEATCPLVRHAHLAVLALARQGYHPVIVGQRDHVEVRGLTGDLDAFDVVLTEGEVRQLPERPRFGVAAQTTQPSDHVRQLVALLRERFPRSEVRFVDTVCRPTKERQWAAIELARESEVVIVIGGAHSNNTRQLVATCARHCARVHHVQSPSDLQADWLDAANTVGLTAGTSTPDDVIAAVEDRLRVLAADREHGPAPVPEPGRLVGTFPGRPARSAAELCLASAS